MTIAQGVAGRVVLKPYATGVMQSNIKPDTAIDPGPTGGVILRRVGTTVAFAKDAFQSAEIRADYQIADFRHGTQRTAGSISGEVSPATYFSLFEAAHRDTSTLAVVLDDTALTSVTSDAALAQFIFGGGDPVALGLRVGDTVRFAGLAAAANNNRNFTITAFSGTSNRTVTVTPAPVTDAVADTAFTVTRPGRASLVPAVNHVSRKFALEIHRSDVDVAQLFTECRVTGYRLQLPATGMATCEIMMMGRGVETFDGAAAPFFTSPAQPTTTGICAAVNGVLLAGGVQYGVVTGVDISFDMSPSADPVVGQNFVADIILGRANVTGTMTAFFETQALYNAFVNETETAILLRIDASSAPNSDAITIYLPRVKFSGAEISNTGENAVTMSMPFQALKYQGLTPGIEQTTIRMHDTAAV